MPQNSAGGEGDAKPGLSRGGQTRGDEGTDETITLALRIFTLLALSREGSLEGRGASPACAVGDSGPNRRDSFAVPFWEFAASTASRSPTQPLYLPEDKPLTRYYLTNTRNVL
jgi:hypothetical protein